MSNARLRAAGLVGRKLVGASASSISSVASRRLARGVASSRPADGDDVPGGSGRRPGSSAAARRTAGCRSRPGRRTGGPSASTGDRRLGLPADPARPRPRPAGSGRGRRPARIATCPGAIGLAGSGRHGLGQRLAEPGGVEVLEQAGFGRRARSPRARRPPGRTRTGPTMPSCDMLHTRSAMRVPPSHASECCACGGSGRRDRSRDCANRGRAAGSPGTGSSGADPTKWTSARDGPGLVWVDVPAWDDEAAAVLPERFGIHQRAAADCARRNPVPKVHVYPATSSSSCTRPERGARGHVHYVELDQFVGPELADHRARAGEPAVGPAGGRSARRPGGRPPTGERPAAPDVALPSCRSRWSPR